MEGGIGRVNMAAVVERRVREEQWHVDSGKPRRVVVSGCSGGGVTCQWLQPSASVFDLLQLPVCLTLCSCSEVAQSACDSYGFSSPRIARAGVG